MTVLREFCVLADGGFETRDEQRVIVRSIYQNVILAPCLILTEAEADRIVAALHDVLATTSPAGRPLVSAGREG